MRGPAVCLGDKLSLSFSWGLSGMYTDVIPSGRAGTGGIYAEWKALDETFFLLEESVDSANETRDTRGSGANETRDTRVEVVELRAVERALGLRKPTPVPLRIAGSLVSGLSGSRVLLGRMAPKEKDEFLLLATAMELRMAAWAPAAETLFHSVEMVDMRLSIFSVQALRLCCSFLRFQTM